MAPVASPPIESERYPLSGDVVLRALPIAAYICDLAGVITNANAEVFSLWGRTPRLNDPADRWSGAVELRSAFDDAVIDPSQCCVAVALRTGEPQQDELVIVRADGSRLAVLAQVSLLHEPSGATSGVLVALSDISERKQAEIAKAHLGAIVASSDDAIIGKTLEGRIVSWNVGAERLFGYTPAEAVGQPVTMIIPKDRHDEERDILSKLVRGERVDHYETIRVTKHGELRDISLTSSPIRDSSGRIVGASKIARDITSRKRNEEQLRALHDELRQADRAKNDFLATLAHELRNPLAPLRSLVYLLERTTDPQKDLPGALSMMDRQLSQLIRLIDDLMDVSRISKNKFELRKEPIDLATVVATAVESSRPILAANRHTFTVELPSVPIRLDADGARLTQAIGNVLNNAAKYTEAAGDVALRVWEEGGHAIVTVTDTGIGVPLEMIDQIFEMFVQVAAGDVRQQGGLGVGLHLARRLAEMHGGTLTATSAGPGQGSTFRFSIPLAPATGTGARPVADAASIQATVRKRVLVVDDNRDAADSLCMFLRVLGHTAKPFYDGLSLLDEGADFFPDVILLDIGLPGIDGYETARRIRETTWGASTCLCALTGWGQDDARRKSREAGFDAHFVKPVDAVTLSSALEHMNPRNSCDPG